jgi:hypothetical protein
MFKDGKLIGIWHSPRRVYEELQFQRNTAPLSSGSSNKQSFLLSASCWFLASLILWPWRSKRHVPPKRWLTFKELHDIILQKIELFMINWLHILVTMVIFRSSNRRHIFLVSLWALLTAKITVYRRMLEWLCKRWIGRNSLASISKFSWGFFIDELRKTTKTLSRDSLLLSWTLRI